MFWVLKSEEVKATPCTCVMRGGGKVMLSVVSQPPFGLVLLTEFQMPHAQVRTCTRTLERAPSSGSVKRVVAALGLEPTGNRGDPPS